MTADKVVVLFTAAPNGISSATPARAETAMRQAGAELDAVYMQRGADVEAVVEMVATLGGSSLEVVSEEDLDKGFEQVADQLAGRFRTTFSAPAGNAKTQELTLASGKASTTVEYAPGAVRAGAANLAPSVAADGGFLDGLTSSSWFIWLIVLLGVAAVVLAVWTLLTMILPDDDNLVRRLKHYEDPYGENADGDEARGDRGHGPHPEAGGGLHRGHGRTPGHPGEARGRPGAGQPPAAGGRGPVLRRGRWRPAGRPGAGHDPQPDHGPGGRAGGGLPAPGPR